MSEVFNVSMRAVVAIHEYEKLTNRPGNGKQLLPYLVADCKREPTDALVQVWRRDDSGAIVLAFSTDSRMLLGAVGASDSREREACRAALRPGFIPEGIQKVAAA